MTPTESVIDRLRLVVRRQPLAAALRSDQGECVSYETLWLRASALATQLSYLHAPCALLASVFR